MARREELGHEARWEYFRVVYGRYRKADREARQVMLDEFCVNTGGAPPQVRDSVAEWAAAGAAGRDPTAGTQPTLRETSARAIGGDLASGGLSLVGRIPSSSPVSSALRGSCWHDSTYTRCGKGALNQSLLR